jgi:phosphoribosylformylglycinamidine synthase
VVAEAVLNLACVGARPLALVNCLNFGNPEHPEVMWELSESVDGMAEACLALGVPVVGGNVSLYNESKGVDIDPTPVVGLLGMVERLEQRPPGVALVDGGSLLLLGPEGDRKLGLAGSRWAWARGAHGGRLELFDAAAHLAVAGLVRGLVLDGLVAGLHDVADGGLGLTLAELVVHAGRGVQVSGVEDWMALFAESPSRVVVCVVGDAAVAVTRRADAAGVPWRALGHVQGDRLVVDGLVDVEVEAAVAAWRSRLPAAFGVAAAH